MQRLDINRILPPRNIPIRETHRTNADGDRSDHRDNGNGGCRIHRIPTAEESRSGESRKASLPSCGRYLSGSYSLCMASMALGNYVNSLMVNIVMAITARGNSHGWIPEDLNEGHIDWFYFLIAILAAINFVFYLVFAKWYQPISHDEDSIKGTGVNRKTISELDQV
ncbi:hypothetical protein Bca4012_026334 [Brassica carinata]|uniref:Proton-dependent oligopeptide transporter family n=1 Tax=Brassica carinata TaxID=52824 RepID=A0A8X8ASK2_BRACI|nr:hypothetical protein Bca52824_023401 [Brassica carinata]